MERKVEQQSGRNRSVVGAVQWPIVIIGFALYTFFKLTKMLTVKHLVSALFLPTLYAIAIVFGVAMLSRYFLEEELSRSFYFSQALIYFLVVVPTRLKSARKNQ
jgi:hypothetical protein